MNPKPTPETSPPSTRRQLLTGAGLLGVSALLAKTAKAGSLWTPRPQPVLTPKPWGLAACTLSPSATEGPYWFNAAVLRQDISEGKPGLPFRLDIQVVKASTCAPVPNAIVDIWHCDYVGIYSGYSGQLNNLDTQGDNYFRGVQVTDSNGAVAFRSVYPGYYPGRCVHIHFKVVFNNQTAITSQLFFVDTFSDEIYAALPDYVHGSRTLNTSDGIYNSQMVIAATPSKGGVAGSFTIVVA